jgi:hypothetical protein
MAASDDVLRDDRFGSFANSGGGGHRQWLLSIAILISLGTKAQNPYQVVASRQAIPARYVRLRRSSPS